MGDAYARWRGHEPTADEPPEPIDAGVGGGAAEFAREADRIFESSTGLRRARMVEPVLRGARVLWVDDYPENNAWECSLLGVFGARVVAVKTTQAALAALGSDDFDLIVSDIAREGKPDEGVRALPALRGASGANRVVFYVRNLSRRRTGRRVRDNPRPERVAASHSGFARERSSLIEGGALNARRPINCSRLHGRESEPRSLQPRPLPRPVRAFRPVASSVADGQADSPRPSAG